MSVESLRPVKGNLLRRYPLVSFFVLSYVFFFVVILIIGAIVSLITVSTFVMGLLIACASWTPNAAAVVVSGVVGGKPQVKRLFNGWLKWRVNGWWYVFGFAPLLIAFGSAGGYAIFGTGIAPEAATKLSGSAFFLMLFFHTIQGATGEELGWRGFALPGLQRHFSPLVSALVLGLIVSGWHGLLHLVSPTGLPEWQFWVSLISYSVIVTWAYNKSHGSVLIATIFHFSFNFGLELVSTGLGLIPLAKLFAVQTAVYAGFAALLIIFNGRSLSKEK